MSVDFVFFKECNELEVYVYENDYQQFDRQGVGSARESGSNTCTSTRAIPVWR